MKHLKHGFTLIELLVVIGIIAILIAIGTVSYTGARNKADQAKVQADFQTMTKLIEVQRATQNMVLKDITGTTCSECTCRNIDPTSSATCMSNLNASWDTITTEQALLIDPWGNPYTWDENEHEVNSSDCRYDQLRSSGKDGILSNSDDVIYDLPHFLCP